MAAEFPCKDTEMLGDDASTTTEVAASTPLRGAMAGIVVLSGAVNLLYLTGSVFMLQVYDRVLPSRSIPTLIALGAIVAGLYVFQGLFDALRSRILVRLAAGWERVASQRAFRAILDGSAQQDRLQPLRDIDQIRGFLTGAGPLALFDLPWIPVYILLCFGFHVWIGVAALSGALVLAALCMTTEILTRRPSSRSAAAASKRLSLADAASRNAEAVRAMGMAPSLAAIWKQSAEEHLINNVAISDLSAGFGSATKVARLALQSAVLATGALLVMLDQATGGIMIASSVLVARALAPVELTVANWRHLVAARQSWRRLRDRLSAKRDKRIGVKLPRPERTLSVSSLGVLAPDRRRTLINNVTFELQAGQGLGVVGESGSGKSTLVRALVGVWPPSQGKVALDGAALDQWSSEHLGRFIGYLPQDVELFAGSVAQNIARFHQDASSDAIISAARAADVHDLICRLPDGYDTLIGDGGAALSAGQRQRIGLARALYGDPFLVVLDEPNSNLDGAGELALQRAIESARARGGIVVIVAHRMSALASVDHVLVLSEGRVRAYGRKSEVLPPVSRSAASGPRISPPPSRERISNLHVVAADEAGS